jgi:long-chain fatty acid transport protein
MESAQMKPAIHKIKLLAVSVAAACALPLAAHATNGYFAPGYGAASIGMGGVGVAFAQNSLSAGANPAGIVDVGMRADIGVGFFNPVRSAATGTPAGGTSAFGFNGEADSSNRYYPIPGMGYVMPWSDRMSLGVAVLANGGMNTTYKPNFYKFGAFGSETLGVNLVQVLMPITVAYKTDTHNAFGVSAVLGAQAFSARGLQAFGAFGISSDPAHLTNNGTDFAQGAGIRVGWRGKFLDDDRLTLGATYASKVYMSRFSKYSGLFAGGGNFDIPANYAVGIAFKATPATTVALDVQRILFSGVPSIGNRGPDANLVVNANNQLGQDGGLGFGWKDQTVYKLGVNYKYNNFWELRAGFNYGKSPIPDDQLAFNVLAPATVERHYTVGFTYSPDKSSAITMAYLRAADNVQQACGLAIVNCARIQMYQNDVELAYSWKF